jgi:hypothetical protein
MRIVQMFFYIKKILFSFLVLFSCLQAPLSGMYLAAPTAGAGASANLLPRIPRTPRRVIPSSSLQAPSSPVTGPLEVLGCAGDMPSFELTAAKGAPGGRRYSVDDASSVGTAVSCLSEVLRSPVGDTRCLAEGAASVIEPHISREEGLDEHSIAIGGSFGVEAFNALEISKSLFTERLPFLRRFIDECASRRVVWSETLREIKNSGEYLVDDHAALESSKKHLAYWTGFQTMFMARLYEFGPKTKGDAAAWVALGRKDGADMYNPELYDELLKYVRDALNHYESIISKAGASASSVNERCVIMRTYWKAFKDAVCLAALGFAF